MKKILCLLLAAALLAAALPACAAPDGPEEPRESCGVLRRFFASLRAKAASFRAAAFFSEARKAASLTAKDAWNALFRRHG